mmetsp:Transcript_22976/g.58759  ORF Transcript_22976/g.58759 Transcript_22976/m.58759 type:complete len:212 (+) Transcript_22976:1574-2209(+)
MLSRHRSSAARSSSTCCCSSAAARLLSELTSRVAVGTSPRAMPRFSDPDSTPVAAYDPSSNSMSPASRLPLPSVPLPMLNIMPDASPDAVRVTLTCMFQPAPPPACRYCSASSVLSLQLPAASGSCMRVCSACQRRAKRQRQAASAAVSDPPSLMRPAASGCCPPAISMACACCASACACCASACATSWVECTWRMWPSMGFAAALAMLPG